MQQDCGRHARHQEDDTGQAHAELEHVDLCDEAEPAAIAGHHSRGEATLVARASRPWQYNQQDAATRDAPDDISNDVDSVGERREPAWKLERR